jgi:hypothetical protein
MFPRKRSEFAYFGYFAVDPVFSITTGFDVPYFILHSAFCILHFPLRLLTDPDPQDWLPPPRFRHLSFII